MDRRKFLLLGTAALAGCAVKGVRMQTREDYDLLKKLSQHVHVADVPMVSRISGIKKGKHFFTVAHGVCRITPFSAVQFPVYLYGEKLEEVVVDLEYDVALYRIPKSLDLPDFPLKFLDEKRELGDLVGLSGNPILQGPNYRFGRITDLDGLSYMNIDFPIKFKGSVGTDINYVKGDSGAPMINIDKMSVEGLCSFEIDGCSYYRGVENWLKYV